MPESLEHFEIGRVEDVTIVTFKGSSIVEEELVQEVRGELLRLVDEERPTKMILHFGNVRYFSSPALSMFIALKGKMGKIKGQIKFCAVSPGLSEVFRITRLDQLFEFSDTEQAALDAFE